MTGCDDVFLGRRRGHLDVLPARLVKRVDQRDAVDGQCSTGSFSGIARQPAGGLRVEAEFIAVGNLIAEIRTDVGLC
jgi:hypothetical protein